MYEKGNDSSRRLLFGDSIVPISSSSRMNMQNLIQLNWEIQFTESIVANVKKRPNGTLDKRVFYLLWDIGNEGSTWIRGITRKAFKKTPRTLKELCGLFVDKRRHSFLNTPISNNLHKLPAELQNYLSSIVRCKVCGNTYFSECKSCGIVQLEIGRSSSKDATPLDFNQDTKFPPLFMKWDIFLQAIRTFQDKPQNKTPPVLME